MIQFMSDPSFGLTAVQTQTKKLEMKKTKLSLRTFTNQDFKDSAMGGSDDSSSVSGSNEGDLDVLETLVDAPKAASRLNP